MEEIPMELNAKAYTITIKEEEVLNQWLDEQLKARLIVEFKLRYAAPCFYIPKEAKYFNKLDLIWGYNNVQIKKENEWKAVFLTNKGLFEPQVMYHAIH